MGQKVSSAVSKGIRRFLGEIDVRILMVGLDASGKTTMLYKLKLGEVVTTIPTIGFNVETVKYKNIDFTVWDVGSRDRMRPLWRHYYQNTQGVIFMIDSNDRERLGEAVDEVTKMWVEDEIRDAAFLILCNKMDLPNAMSVDEVRAAIPAPPPSIAMNVMQTCAVTGDGLYEALDWLSQELQGGRKTKAAASAAAAAQGLAADALATSKGAVAAGTFAKGAAVTTPVAPARDYTRELEALEARLSAVAGQTDAEVCAGMDSEAMSNKGLTHPVYIRYLYALLGGVTDRSKGRATAVDAAFRNMERIHRRFSVTVHYFWLQLTDLALHMQPPDASIADDEARFTEWVARSPHLLNVDLVVEYYSHGLVFSTPKTLAEFVLPDLKPLPSVINFNVAH